MSDKPYLTERQVALRFNVTQRTVQRWRRVNEGPPYYRFAGTIRYLLSDIEAYERAARVDPTVTAA